MNTDIIVVGAGASGLMAARTLAQAGKKVVILEARARSGGRIYTNTLVGEAVELGAEFIHGDLPVTKTLLQMAGIAYTETGGEMVRISSGKSEEPEEPAEHWDLLIKKLEALNSDMPIEAFMEAHFAEEKYRAFREEVVRYAEGLDAADASKASAKALLEEWKEDETEYRVAGGYGGMIQFLEEECLKSGATIVHNSPVTKIDWKSGSVRAICVNEKIYEAAQLILSIPISLLQNGRIEWEPALPPAISHAINGIGMGYVIKLLLLFAEPFWEEDYPDTSFFISEEAIPTWWTQYPQKSNVLTGWISGRAALAVSDYSDEALLAAALQSLAAIFKKDIAELKELLKESVICNWTIEPYTEGAYAYSKVESPGARNILGKGLENTIYFAGEAMYDGPAMGTVEAALAAGIDAARNILTKNDIC